MKNLADESFYIKFKIVYLLVSIIKTISNLKELFI
jgi:hypothetical protein